MTVDYRDPNTSAGQVKRLARAYHRRFERSLGASLSVEDVEQEIWIVWTKVVERFDPSLGCEFNALLTVSALNRVRGLASFQHQRTQMIARSLNERVGEEENVELVDLIEDHDAVDAETEIGNRQHAELLLSKMDPRLRQMVEILRDQPPEFLEDVEGLMAKAERAAAMGLRVQLPRRITLSMLTELYGLSRCSRYRLIDELKEVMKNV